MGRRLKKHYRYYAVEKKFKCQNLRMQHDKWHQTFVYCEGYPEPSSMTILNSVNVKEVRTLSLMMEHLDVNRNQRKVSRAKHNFVLVLKTHPIDIVCKNLEKIHMPTLKFNKSSFERKYLRNLQEDYRKWWKIVLQYVR